MWWTGSCNRITHGEIAASSKRLSEYHLVEKVLETLNYFSYSEREFCDDLFIQILSWFSLLIIHGTAERNIIVTLYISHLQYFVAPPDDRISIDLQLTLYPQVEWHENQIYQHGPLLLILSRAYSLCKVTSIINWMGSSCNWNAYFDCKSLDNYHLGVFCIFIIYSIIIFTLISTPMFSCIISM